jgi:hypothetical protein
VKDNCHGPLADTDAADPGGGHGTNFLGHDGPSGLFPSLLLRIGEGPLTRPSGTLSPLPRGEGDEFRAPESRLTPRASFPSLHQASVAQVGRPGPG